MPVKGRQIADILHKTTVTFLIGLTIWGAGCTGLRFYNYFTVVRPERIRLAEQQLLENTDSS